MDRDRIRVVVETALSIALAVALRRFAVFQLPFGGDVSLAMLPLVVLALRRGVVAGMVAGALFSPLDYLMFPSPIVHWIQPLLDYPVAYGLVGLAGLARPMLLRAVAAQQPFGEAVAAVVATVVGVAGRFAAHFVSGVVFFGSYAPKGQPVWLYSAVYNGSYLLPSLLACAVAAAILVPVLERSVPAADPSWTRS